MAEPEKKWKIPTRGGLLALLLAVALLAALGKFTRPDRTGDYPAAIMVDGTVYLVSVNPLPAGTVDEAEITGCVDSYTETFPEKDGQQNFSREAALPYAPAEGGLPCCLTARGTCASPPRLMTMACSCPAETAPERPGPDNAEPS